jgi:Alw26I/Eco31I/Esp3I family type II restriction m6 adenine DNA methyltransferase
MKLKFLVDLELNDIIVRLKQKGLDTSDYKECQNFLESTEGKFIVEDVHSSIIDNLVYSYFSLLNKENAETATRLMLCNNFNHRLKFYNNLNLNEITKLSEDFHLAFLNSDYKFTRKGVVTKKSKSHLIEKGAVYTQKKITSDICSNVINNLILKGLNLENLKFLDFACGTGRFYQELVVLLKEKGLSLDKIILSNLYALDLDNVAVNVTRLKAFDSLQSKNIKSIETLTKHIILRNGLARANTMFSVNSFLKNDDFEGLLQSGFDAIVSNPPYLVLKPNKRKMDADQFNRIYNQVNYYRNCGDYKYSIEGMLNLYQLSLESMIKMLKDKGEMGIICPSTLFADKSARSLRRYLIKNNNLREIKYFEENEDLFENITQATSIFFLEKGGNTNTVLIKQNGKEFSVNINLIEEVFPKYMEIPGISEEDWTILKKLQNFKKLKDFSNIRNKRGELDLSINNSYITKEETPHRLVRGNMISGSSIAEGINGEYVKKEFLDIRSSDFLKFDFGRPRLVCPQISNKRKLRRLHFIFCSPMDILGNSCNYLSSDTNTLKKLYIILNSSLLDWRFKLTSSNNHINNYELDDLPICDLSKVDINQKFLSQEELDDYVSVLYGLSNNDNNYIKGKYNEII